jgi:hypothetical protein
MWFLFAYFLTLCLTIMILYNYLKIELSALLRDVIFISTFNDVTPWSGVVILKLPITYGQIQTHVY